MQVAFRSRGLSDFRASLSVEATFGTDAMYQRRLERRIAVDSYSTPVLYDAHCRPPGYHSEFRS